MRPRAFVLEEQRRDLDMSTLAKYGDLCYVFPKNVKRPSVFSGDLYLQRLYDRLQELDFNPDVDYIVAVGGIVELVLSIGELSSCFTKLKLLVYCSTASRYVDRNIGINCRSD